MRVIRITRVLSITYIVQLCIIGLIIYNFWFIRIIGEYPIIHWGLLLTAILCSFIKSGINGIINVTDEYMKPLWIFTVVEAVFGIVIATNYQNFFKAIVDVFEYAIIMGIILWICKEKESTEWLINPLLLIFTICAVTALKQNFTINGRLVLGLSGNSNDLGIKMVYGLLCLMIIIFGSKDKRLIIYMIGLIEALLFLYVIVLTSSRKSLIIALLLIVTCVFIVLPKSLSTKKRLILILLLPFITFGIFKIIQLYLPTFYATKMFHRITYINDGYDARMSLLNEAINIFRKYPLFGVGLNNFKNYSSANVYSHSTIGETLSCTGVVGSLLWIWFYYSYVKCFAKMALKEKKISIQWWIALIWFIIIQIMSLGVILYYDYASMLMLTLIGSILILENKRKEI